MDKSKKLIIVIILLVVIIGGVSFYAFHQAKENKEMSELFAVEKLEMENEYTTFATHPPTTIPIICMSTEKVLTVPAMSDGPHIR